MPDITSIGLTSFILLVLAGISILVAVLCVLFDPFEPDLSEKEEREFYS